LKMQPLSEAFIKKKQDQLNNDCFYEILEDKITNLLQDRNVQKKALQQPDTWHGLCL